MRKRIIAALLSLTMVSSYFCALPSASAESIKGDVNSDGVVDVTDLTQVSLYLIGDAELTDEQKELADVDYDGEVKLTDLAKIRQYISKKIDSLARTGNTLSEDTLALPVYKSSRTEADNESRGNYSAFVSSFSDDVLLNTDDEKEGVNKVYSPVSIYMAASMLAECCDGKSLDELLAFLDVSDKETLGKINQDIFDSLYFDNESNYCKISNSIWIDDEYDPAEAVIKSLADKYYAASFRRNLNSQNDCDEISEWINDHTSGKFRPVILADPDSILKIINTVTFKDSWMTGFESSRKGTFKGSDGDVECDFMVSSASAVVYEDENFTTFSKPFEDGYYMNFVLPAEGKTVSDILSDDAVMQKVLEMKNGKTYEVSAAIPKFSSASKFDLEDFFKAAGVNRMFDKVDIEPLLDAVHPYVDEIVHEAVIDVDEKGCEAAAYTLISVKAESACEYLKFTVDRPFVYFISDDAGTPVFIGVVNDPTQK